MNDHETKKHHENEIQNLILHYTVCHCIIMYNVKMLRNDFVAYVLVHNYVLCYAFGYMQVIEILASRIVLTALENVLSEIQEKCNKESLIDLHNSQTSAILREQNETIISEELISNNQTTPITRQSQHRLVRSGNINISSSNTSSSDIETSDSYNDEQSSTQNSSDELNY